MKNNKTKTAISIISFVLVMALSLGAIFIFSDGFSDVKTTFQSVIEKMKKTTDNKTVEPIPEQDPTIITVTAVPETIAFGDVYTADLSALNLTMYDKSAAETLTIKWNDTDITLKLCNSYISDDVVLQYSDTGYDFQSDGSIKYYAVYSSSENSFYVYSFIPGTLTIDTDTAIVFPPETPYAKLDDLITVNVDTVVDGKYEASISGDVFKLNGDADTITVLWNNEETTLYKVHAENNTGYGITLQVYIYSDDKNLMSSSESIFNVTVSYMYAAGDVAQQTNTFTIYTSAPGTFKISQSHYEQ